MLVLGRNLNETIVIDGKIFIKIVRGKLGNNLKVAIEAPRDVSIVRGELFPGIEEMEAKWARALGPDSGAGPAAAPAPAAAQPSRGAGQK